MATTFNIRLDEAAPAGLTLPTGALGAWNVTQGVTFGANAKQLDDQNAGAAQSSQGLSYTANGAAESLGIAQFCSRLLAGQTINAGNWTIAYAAAQSGAGPSWSGYMALYLVNGSTGAIRSTIFALGVPTGTATGRTNTTETTVDSTTASGSSVTAQAGDYLVLELGIQNTAGNGAHVTSTLYTSGTVAISADNVAASSAFSVLTAPVVITFFVPSSSLALRIRRGRATRNPPEKRFIGSRSRRSPKISTGQTGIPIARRPRMADPPRFPPVQAFKGRSRRAQARALQGIGQTGTPIVPRHRQAHPPRLPPLRFQNRSRRAPVQHTGSVPQLPPQKRRRTQARGQRFLFKGVARRYRSPLLVARVRIPRGRVIRSRWPRWWKQRARAQRSLFFNTGATGATKPPPHRGPVARRHPTNLLPARKSPRCRAGTSRVPVPLSEYSIHRRGRRSLPWKFPALWGRSRARRRPFLQPAPGGGMIFAWRRRRPNRWLPFKGRAIRRRLPTLTLTSTPRSFFRKVRLTRWPMPLRTRIRRTRVPGTGLTAAPILRRHRAAATRSPFPFRGRVRRLRVGIGLASLAVVLRSRRARAKVRQPFPGRTRRARIGTGLTVAPVARRRRMGNAKLALRPAQFKGRVVRSRWLYLSETGIIVAGPYSVTAGQIFCPGAVQGDIVGEW